MQRFTSSGKSKSIWLSKELWFQVAIFIIFFLVSSISRERGRIEFNRLFFLTNYLVTALCINYFLLPRYFYNKKYGRFWLGVAFFVTIGILVEELVIEQLFFPETRGASSFTILFTILKMTPVVMLMVGFKFAWDAQSKQAELDTLKSVVAESQLQFLKSQINPHFLFNSLNNLYSYALENSPKTPKIILELSSLLRYMLYDCREERVPLSKEITYIENFVRLQGLQIEDRGDINFNATGDFDRHFIAPLILIVFVENCFKHSTSSLSDKIVIDIEIKLENNKLIMKCANSFSTEKNTENLTQGIGMENVQSRLNLLYPEAHSLKISNLNDVYQVYLELELDK